MKETFVNHHVQNNLLEFIDITNIDNKGESYGYKFNCKNGKEQRKSKNGKEWVFNGKEGTLCPR